MNISCQKTISLWGNLVHALACCAVPVGKLVGVFSLCTVLFGALLQVWTGFDMVLCLLHCLLYLLGDTEESPFLC